ncbi:MAG: TIGR01212 family radical SAM protein [Bacteroidota bacterium]|nr:TIGR01212 family radical SAM protein [Bacteroidota bacterium]
MTVTKQKYSWGNSRRFNAYSNYLKMKFGERFQKVTIDAGFTCPNRDGKITKGGCTYCDNNAFNPSYNNPEKSVYWQVQEGIEFHKKRYRKANKYIAYFQPYSNTYAPLDELKEIYEQALKIPEIIGLSIGTRPDCVDDEKLDYLKQLNEKYFISIEYGIESCFDKTLERINRGHNFLQTKKAIKKTAERGIHTGAHLIFGLPGETKEMMLKEAEIISELPLNSIKFHQLQILKNTAIEKEFKNNPEDFINFKLDEYIDFIIKFVEKLNPEISIERFAGEVPPRFLAKKTWELLRNDQLLNLIEKKMEEIDSWQGKRR